MATNRRLANFRFGSIGCVALLSSGAHAGRVVQFLRAIANHHAASAPRETRHAYFRNQQPTGSRRRARREHPPRRDGRSWRQRQRAQSACGQHFGSGPEASSTTNYGIRASSERSAGLRASSVEGRGLEGRSTDHEGVVGTSKTGVGVYGTGTGDCRRGRRFADGSGKEVEGTQRQQHGPK